MNTLTSDLKHDNLHAQLYSKISLNTRTGCEKKSTGTNGFKILNSNQRFELRYCGTSLKGCPSTPDKDSYISLHFGYSDQHHRTRENVTFTLTTKVPGREAGNEKQRPGLESAIKNGPLIRQNGRFTVNKTPGRCPLFPASRRHVPERPSSFIVDFDLHDNFSLSMERVIQKTSNVQGFIEYVDQQKHSKKFRHPAVISLSAATGIDIAAGAGSFGQEAIDSCRWPVAGWKKRKE